MSVFSETQEILPVELGIQIFFVVLLDFARERGEEWGSRSFTGRTPGPDF